MHPFMGGVVLGGPGRRVAEQTEFVDADSCSGQHFGLALARTWTIFAKCLVVFKTQRGRSSNAFYHKVVVCSH